MFYMVERKMTQEDREEDDNIHAVSWLILEMISKSMVLYIRHNNLFGMLSFVVERQQVLLFCCC